MSQRKSGRELQQGIHDQPVSNLRNKSAISPRRNSQSPVDGIEPKLFERAENDAPLVAGGGAVFARAMAGGNFNDPSTLPKNFEENFRMNKCRLAVQS